MLNIENITNDILKKIDIIKKTNQSYSPNLKYLDEKNTFRFNTNN